MWSYELDWLLLLRNIEIEQHFINFLDEKTIQKYLLRYLKWQNFKKLFGGCFSNFGRFCS